MRQIMNESLEPAQQASVCEHAALCLLDDSDLSPDEIAQAQAYATIAQSLRLRGCEEWLASIRDDGVGVG